MNASRTAVQLLLVLCLTATAVGCPGTARYGGIPEDVVRQNILGTAYLGQQKWKEAEQAFRGALEQRPGDPLLLNNVAVALIQQGLVDEANTFLERALESDPAYPYAHYNLGLIRKNTGEFAAAADHFDAVAAFDPEDLLTQYNRGIVLSRIDRDADAEQAFRNALERDPSHVSSLYGLGRFLMQKGETEEGARLIALSQEIRQRSGLDEAVGLQYGEQGPFAMGVDYDGSTLTAPEPIAVAFQEVTRADPSPDSGKVGWVLTRMEPGNRPALLFTDGRALRSLDPSGVSDSLVVLPQGVRAIVALGKGDLDNDGVVELVALLAGADGRFFPALIEQEEGGGLGRVEEQRFGSWSLRGQLTGVDVTTLDYDHDGDVDLFCCWAGAGAGGCALGTNDGSGRFEVRESTEHGFRLEIGAGPLRVGFSDADNDRDIDLLVAEPAGVHLLSNQRDGTFAEVSDRAGLGSSLESVRSFAVADLNKDGWMDLVVARPDALQWLANRRGSFDPPASLGSDAPGEGLVVLDLDNDGFLDLAHGTAAQPVVLRNVGAGQWSALDRPLAGAAEGSAPVGAFDADGDGDLDLVLVERDSAVSLMSNEGGNARRWISIENHGVNDNRFGVGAKVEVLAGALRQKFEVTDPLPLHVGLGQRERVESVRHLWPSGVLQDETELAASSSTEVTQLDRKGTSCPLLYAWRDGRWRFVTDFLGGCAIGYRHADGSYSVPDTDEYVRVDGGLSEDEQGLLRLRVNNQLEEVIWFDKLELVVVDHPAGTEVYPNERLMPGPPWPEFALFASADIRPVAAARGVEDGSDLTALLRASDRRWVDNFELLPFKGYAEPHTIELDLGDLPRGERVVLLLDGWIDYADSTANLAASQAGARLTPPELRVADGRGGWIETKQRMGFPAGLPKTMAVDLSGLFPGDDHRVRIATTMRIYWDRARVMVGGEETALRVRRLRPLSADLRFGGFPAPIGPNGKTPLGYDPESVVSRATWKAHVGAYTAFGEVTDRLLAVDDRFVTTKSGDEVELRFRSPGPLRDGLRRTYLLFADGFGKDMDPNSAANAEVGPIPFHGMPGYPYAEGILPPQHAEAGEGGARVVPSSPRGWPGAPPQLPSESRGGS
jgi:Tfp pilus assembly protein PilF